MALGLIVELGPDAILLGADRLIDDTADIIQLLIIPTAFFYLGRKLSIAYMKQKEAKALYKGLFQNSPFGIVIIDPATAEIIQTNFKAANQLGYTIEELTGKKIHEIDQIEDRNIVLGKIQMIREKGRGEFETKQRTKGGTLKDIRVISRFIHIFEKKYICAFGKI